MTARMSPAEAVMLCRFAKGETWARVPEFPDYEVSDLGRLRSWRKHRRARLAPTSPRIMKLSPDPKGYLTTRIVNEFGARTIKVHVLVALAFLGPRPEGLQVRHLDGDNQNNRLDNLLYGTQLENMADRVALKTHCKQGHEFTEENTYRQPRGERNAA